MEKKRRENNQKKSGFSLSHQIKTGVGAIVCVVLLPVLLLNITLIIKSYVNTDKVPSVGGYLPMIVLTDSMYPGIQSGDLIICHTLEPEEVQAGDVISFFDPAGNGSTVVTHRVVELTSEDGGLAYRTKGDANNAEDAALVPAENLVGIYRTRLAGVGNVAMFMQTTAGLAVCVVCPLILLIAYDILRRRKYEKEKQKDTEALLAELEELKQQRERRISKNTAGSEKTGAGKKRAPHKNKSAGEGEERTPQKRRRTGEGEERAPQKQRRTGKEGAPQRRQRAGEEEERTPQRRRRTGEGEERAPRKRRQTEEGEEKERTPQKRRRTEEGEEKERTPQRRSRTGEGDDGTPQRRRRTGEVEERAPQKRKRTGDGRMPRERQASGQDDRSKI